MLTIARRNLENKHAQHANDDAAPDTICLAIVEKKLSDQQGCFS